MKQAGGIVPYTFLNGELLFLMQRSKYFQNGNKSGWTDFGGAGYIGDFAYETAAREFCEETSSIFFLETMKRQKIVSNKEHLLKSFHDKYKLVAGINKKVSKLSANMQTIKNNFLTTKEQKIICELLGKSIEYYVNLLSSMSEVNSIPCIKRRRKVYESFFLEVPYIPVEHIPMTEETHTEFDELCLRECKWMTLNDLKNIAKHEFHGRQHAMKFLQNIPIIEKKIMSNRFKYTIDVYSVLCNNQLLYESFGSDVTIDTPCPVLIGDIPLFNSVSDTLDAVFNELDCALDEFDSLTKNRTV